jgi:hypothetical protein
MNTLLGLPSRITSKIQEDKKTKCWNWTGYTHESGYGLTKYGKKVVNTHRLMYKLFYGDIPENNNVIHDCKNILCCNPEHLSLHYVAPKVKTSIISKKGSFTINKHDTIVFRDEWSEKDIFGYSEYEVIDISSKSCTVKEKISGHVYDKVKLTQIRPLNLN